MHDAETAEYVFSGVDRRSGIPALSLMVADGIEAPAPDEVSRGLKRGATAMLDAGPPGLDPELDARLRYEIGDMLDDLRDPRPCRELLGIGGASFASLANYVLRSRGRWSAPGKAIAAALGRLDPLMAETYVRAFELPFRAGDAGEVLQLAENILAPRGGPHFDGWRSAAPSTRRSSRPGRRKIDPG